MKSFVTILFLSFVWATSISNTAAQDFPAGPQFEAGSVAVNAKHADETRPTKENRVITTGLLSVSDQDRNDFQAFLSQPHTGLIRLLPREMYDWRIYKTKPLIDIRGGGAYYSFFFLAHEYGYGSDLQLEKGDFGVGFAGADYGMLSDLGDVPLEPVSLDDAHTWFMLNYVPPQEEPEARSEAMRFHSPVKVDGITYRRTLPALVNHTYLIRSIVYDHSDVMVAFRVVRKDQDGSMIIAWKLLKKFARPHLQRS